MDRYVFREPRVAAGFGIQATWTRGLLKVLPVVLKDPRSMLNTFALLDKGSTATAATTCQQYGWNVFRYRDYPQGNHPIRFSSNSPGNNVMPELQNMQIVPNTGRRGQVNTTFTPSSYMRRQGQIVSGIDRTFECVPTCSNNNSAAFITGHPSAEQLGIPSTSSIGNDYKNRTSYGSEQNINMFFGSGNGQQMSSDHKLPSTSSSFGNDYQNRTFTGPTRFKKDSIPPQHSSDSGWKTQQLNFNGKNIAYENVISLAEQKQTPQMPATKSMQVNLFQDDAQNKTKNRSDILKTLLKTGLRVFSGPVGKVLKWHKALQDVEVSVVYEIVAKCVSVRPGEGCAKNLVLRDENGPAIQVVYYEIDYLLPQLKVPTTIRVLGRMMPGTCRLQAYSVRLATGDDVAMLARRAAVSAHHVAKLCDYRK